LLARVPSNTHGASGRRLFCARDLIPRANYVTPFSMFLTTTPSRGPCSVPRLVSQSAATHAHTHTLTHTHTHTLTE
jgi:hypothetical protein